MYKYITVRTAVTLLDGRRDGNASQRPSVLQQSVTQIFILPLGDGGGGGDGGEGGGGKTLCHRV